jgi:hypothetical protein
MGVAHYLPYGQTQKWGFGGELIAFFALFAANPLTITKRA